MAGPEKKNGQKNLTRIKFPDGKRLLEQGGRIAGWRERQVRS